MVSRTLTVPALLKSLSPKFLWDSRQTLIYEPLYILIILLNSFRIQWHRLNIPVPKGRMTKGKAIGPNEDWKPAAYILNLLVVQSVPRESCGKMYISKGMDGPTLWHCWLQASWPLFWLGSAHFSFLHSGLLQHPEIPMHFQHFILTDLSGTHDWPSKPPEIWVEPFLTPQSLHCVQVKAAPCEWHNDLLPPQVIARCPWITTAASPECLED